jgi:hypothetical protein
LLTYDSDVIGSYTSICDEYEQAFEEEVLKHRTFFASKQLPKNVVIRLFLMPLKDKAILVQQMDAALKACQAAF